MSDRVKVKRDGPRGWHWIAAESYDPAKHELVDAPSENPAPKKRGRKPKALTEKDNGNG